MVVANDNDRPVILIPLIAPSALDVTVIRFSIASSHIPCAFPATIANGIPPIRHTIQRLQVSSCRLLVDADYIRTTNPVEAAMAT